MSAASLDTESRWTRSLVTPEGVDLRLEIASAGQRATAFLIDAAIITGGLVVFTIACAAALYATIGQAWSWSGGVIATIWILGFFLARNAYFMAFEAGPRAATPGKRTQGLRVATRGGEALGLNAVFTRNALREIEVFLPLIFLFTPGSGVAGLLAALGLMWTGAFALFPLFNRDRLRLGDLLAGTWVVRAPRRRLLLDLAAAAETAAPRFAFTGTQIDVYGVKELQVLEDVLRRRHAVSIRAVAERIRTKIGWTAREAESDYEFLDAYYVALRRRLEQQMLLGRRRRDKHDRGEGPGRPPV